MPLPVRRNTTENLFKLFHPYIRPEDKLTNQNVYCQIKVDKSFIKLTLLILSYDVILTGFSSFMLGNALCN